MELKYKEKYEVINREMKRYKKKYDLLYQWMRLKQKGIRLGEFFQDRQLKNIALYGMGDMGRLICEELSETGIVKFGIDKQATAWQEGIPIYTLEKVGQKAEAILITPVLITDKIEDDIYDVLGEQTTFVFEEIIFELSRKYGIASELWAV